MKYKDLLKIRNETAKIITDNKMSNWEVKKAKQKAKCWDMSIIKALHVVIRCRNLMGSLAD